MDIQAFLDFLKTIPLDQFKNQVIPILIAGGDKVFAASPNFLVKLGWTVIKAYLVSQEGPQTTHAALTAK